MKNIYAIVAPQRSGHHAFINTLLLRNDTPLLFINNPKLDKQFYFRAPIARKPSYRFQFNQVAKDLFESPEEVKELSGIFYSSDPPERDKLKALLRNNDDISLIINFEDGYIDQDQTDEYLIKAKRFTGCGNLKMIRFCRDPLNLIATKLVRTQFYRQKEGAVVAKDVGTNFNTILNELIHRFEVDLQFSNQNNDNEITIDYASWLNDASYASQKADELGLTTHPPMAQSTIHGGGSSFEGGAAAGLAYLQRFTRMIGTEPFDTIVSRLEAEISLYYQKLNLSIFTVRHPAMGNDAHSSDLGR